MSAYRVHESAIRAQDAIVDALCDRARQHAIARGRDGEAAAAAVKAGVQIHGKPQHLGFVRLDARQRHGVDRDDEQAGQRARSTESRNHPERRCLRVHGH